MQRGNKLWEGSRMILPEHREELLQSDVEYYQPVILDEQELEQMNRQILWALEERAPVLLHYAARGKEGWRLSEIAGEVIAIQAEKRQLLLRSANGVATPISFAAIQRVITHRQPKTP